VSRFLALAEFWLALAFVGVACSLSPPPLTGHEAEVVAVRRLIDDTGTPIVRITVAWTAATEEGEIYEQETADFRQDSREAVTLGAIGRCVLVSSSGALGISLRPCH